METYSMDNMPENLTEYIQYYLRTDVYPVFKPSSAEHYADNLLKHVVPSLGHKRLEALTTPMVQQFLQEQARFGNLKTNGPLSAKSLQNLRKILYACMKQAVVDGLIERNPVTDTFVKRRSKQPVCTVSEDDRQRLVDFLTTDPNLMNLPILFAADYGLRRGELCALQWSDYDGQMIHIRNTVKRLKSNDGGVAKTELVFGPAKTLASQRKLLLSKYHRELLEEQKNRYRKMFGREPGNGYIFYSSSGGVTDPDNLSHYFSDVLAGLGIPHTHLHALRHTFATRALERGIDIGTVSGLLGHTEVSTTMHYYIQARQKAMDSAVSALFGETDSRSTILQSMMSGPAETHTYNRRKGFAPNLSKAM